MATVLITGANRGLGAEFAKQYAEQGDRVLGCARNPQSMLSHENVTPLMLDLNDPNSLAQLKESLNSTAIDILINCAGTMGKQSFGEVGLDSGRFGQFDRDEWLDIFSINVLGPMAVTEALIDNVLASEQKKVITLSSIAGSIETNKIGGMYAYRASKAAVNAIMRSMAADLAQQGVIATAIHPGWVKTDMGGSAADIDTATSVAGMRRVIAELTPQGAGRFWVYDGSELPW